MVLDNFNPKYDGQPLFTEEEIKVINEARAANTGETNQRLIFAQLFEAKMNLLATKKLIASNNVHEAAMRKLSWALVFVGGIQAIATLVQVFSKGS